MSCLDRNMAVFRHYRHYEGLRLLPSVCEQIIIQQTLIGKLGRDRVCALVVDNVEKPGDIDGIVYVNVDDNGYWKVAVANDMKAVGFNIDLNKVF